MRVGDLPGADVRFEPCEGVAAFFLDGGHALRADGVACLAYSTADPPYTAVRVRFGTLSLTVRARGHSLGAGR